MPFAVGVSFATLEFLHSKMVGCILAFCQDFEFGVCFAIFNCSFSTDWVKGCLFSKDAMWGFDLG